MITFGLTGGIACGKSTVTKTFLANDIPMVDADIVAREVVRPGSIGLDQVIGVFGNEYLQDDGTLNRIALGNLVFHNEEAMRLINAIMAPLINHESRRQLRAWHTLGYKIVGYDAALIIEQGNASKYKPLIVVACPKDTQIERLMKRNGLTHEAAMARINSQISVEEKVKVADYVIETNGTIEESISQTEKIIQKLRDNVSIPKR
jgi:dephospho-CoA kinase